MQARKGWCPTLRWIHLRKQRRFMLEVICYVKCSKVGLVVKQEYSLLQVGNKMVSRDCIEQNVFQWKVTARNTSENNLTFSQLMPLLLVLEDPLQVFRVVGELLKLLFNGWNVKHGGDLEKQAEFKHKTSHEFAKTLNSAFFFHFSAGSVIAAITIHRKKQQ